jgi:hypothetical protein
MRNLMAVVAISTAAFWVSTANAQPAKPGEKAVEKPPAEAKPADTGAAAKPAPMTPPKPAPENEVIKKSAGTWSCEGTAKGPDGQEMKYKSSWTVKPTLGGHWFTVVYKRSKSGPMPAFEGNATVGFNVAEKKYAFVGFDNLGGWINLSSSDGALFAGEGSPMGKKGPVKFTFTPGKDKKGEESDKLFDVTLDFGAAGSTESCKK